MGNSGPAIHTFLWHYYDEYLHIFSYLHLADNRNELNRKDKSFCRLWKIKDLSEILNDTLSKSNNPSESHIDPPANEPHVT
jgi:hypothetical protein